MQPEDSVGICAAAQAASAGWRSGFNGDKRKTPQEIKMSSYPKFRMNFIDMWKDFLTGVK